ncbi:hypothetical protein BBJ29_006711 [Phytophthora kernoviae]|uniref:Uncharacterized protein n=1 Tax=Phytophthora kernoviae TaxID=325452 RepID=A0A3F2RFS3_9STRA|nr:hypothetical protein BBP00_00008286 [Phytophthora kernoviae]RLN71351.1 hypothetical protein BBJ29_006711 [Phytophthora kernoviae]
MASLLELVNMMQSSDSCMCSLASVSRLAYSELFKLDRLDSKLTITFDVGSVIPDRNVDGPREDEYLSGFVSGSLKLMLRPESLSSSLEERPNSELLGLDEKLILVSMVSKPSLSAELLADGRMMFSTAGAVVLVDGLTVPTTSEITLSSFFA